MLQAGSVVRRFSGRTFLELLSFEEDAAFRQVSPEGKLGTDLDGDDLASS